jgi:hypothetical protein
MSRTAPKLDAAQQQKALLKLAKLAQRPLDDAAAAQTMMKGLQEALVEFPGLDPASEAQRLKSKEAAQLTTAVTAAMQCVGWLVMSRYRDTMDLSDTPFWAAVNRGILYMYSSLNRLPVGLDLLRAALQPPAALKVPGGCLAQACRKHCILCCSMGCMVMLHHSVSLVAQSSSRGGAWGVLVSSSSTVNATPTTS